MKSLISDPDHIPQKRKKIIIEFPNGKNIPKEMQYLVDKGLTEVKDPKLYNHLIDAMKGKPMFSDREFELYWVGNTVMIYDDLLEIIWVTKDSKPEELTPEYWAQFE